VLGEPSQSHVYSTPSFVTIRPRQKVRPHWFFHRHPEWWGWSGVARLALALLALGMALANDPSHALCVLRAKTLYAFIVIH